MIKSRFEGAENINETTANESITKINDFITQLNDAKALVENANTKEELVAASEKIKTILKSIDFDVLNYAEKIINSKVGEIYSRSRALETSLNRVLERLNNKGIDTSDIANLILEFREHLDNAKEYMDLANEKFEQAKEIREDNRTQAKAMLEEGKDLTREAHNELKEAHKVLMQMVKMINQKGENFNPDAISDEDIIELSEPESN
jgi:uncharacterized coiled-coil DUF342 family protein